MQDHCGDLNFCARGNTLRFILFLKSNYRSFMFFQLSWYGGFMGWNTPIRLRHITSGRYLGVVNGEVCVIHRDKANAEAITFILTPTKVS